jgi:P-type Cu+ transporter
MATHTDPVCGMKVDDKKAAAQSKHEDQTYWFCSAGCKAMFDAHPERYASVKVTA